MLPRDFVDRYELLGEIGRGGMSTVIEARHRELDRHVAVKILDRKLFDDPENLRRFVDESKLTARLNHPNIIQVFEASATYRCAYIVYEFCDGEPLAALLDGKTPWPWRDAVRFAIQVGEGLEFAHQHGVIHRDVKPENLLIRPNGRVQIADFGLAKTLFRESGFSTQGKVMGTPHYMAPEQARGKAPLPASDVYSLAVVLYELVTGRQPFKGKSPVEVLRKQVREMPPRPVELVPDLPADLDAWIMAGLEKDPTRRITTAQDFVDGLHDLLRGRSPRRAVAAARRGRSWTALLGRAVLVGSLLGGIGWMAWQQFLHRALPRDLRVHVYARSLLCSWRSDEPRPSELRVGAPGGRFRVLRREGLRMDHVMRVERLEPGRPVVLRWMEGERIVTEKRVTTLARFAPAARIRSRGLTWAELVLEGGAAFSVSAVACRDEAGRDWPLLAEGVKLLRRRHRIRIDPLPAGGRLVVSGRIEGADGLEEHPWSLAVQGLSLAEHTGTWSLPGALAPVAHAHVRWAYSPADERLLLPLRDGRVHAFDLAMRTGRTFAGPAGLSGGFDRLVTTPVAAGSSLVVFPMADDVQAWRLPPGGRGADGVLCQLLWRRAVVPAGALWGSPQGRRILFVTAPKSADGPPALRCVEAATGEELWSRELPSGGARVHIAGTEKAGAVVVPDGGLHVFDLADGRLLWRISAVAGAWGAPSVEADLVTVADAAVWRLLELSTSRLRFERPLEGVPRFGPWVDGRDSRVWIVPADGVLEQRDLDGELRGRTALPIGTEHLTRAGGRFYGTGRAGERFRVARSNGLVLWELPGEATENGPAPAGEVVPHGGWTWWVDGRGAIHGVED